MPAAFATELDLEAGDRGRTVYDVVNERMDGGPPARRCSYDLHALINP